MTKTTYSVVQVKNTKDATMGLYITDPNQVEHYIADIPAGGTSAQLMPSKGTWAWKPVIAAMISISDPAASSPSKIIDPQDKFRKLGEGNDGGRKFAE